MDADARSLFPLRVRFFWNGWHCRPRAAVQRNFPEYGGFSAWAGPFGVIVRRV